MVAFWYVIFALGIIAAIINLSLAVTRRKQPMVAAARGFAGLLSLAAVVGIIVGKAIQISHPPLQPQEVFIATGVFIFAVLLLPSYADRGSKEAKPTLQQRAARPANATVRLREAGSDEWVN